ncbi:MAG: DinB family protein [Candidatus Hodarchaeales archaeon]
MTKKESKIFSNAFQEQYGAAIEMLEQVIQNCPEIVWNDRTSGPPFWQVAYHTMWYLDWYLGRSNEERETFKPMFNEKRFEKLEKLPEETLSREKIKTYLFDIKKKCKNRLEQLTLEELIQPSVFEWHGSSILSSLIYNIRHVMLHIGALNSRLLRKGIKLENWVSQAPITLKEG